jgi:hypothetical protein
MRSQRPRHDKSCVSALYGASQRRVYKRKGYSYNKKLGFSRVLPDRLKCARSHASLQVPCGAALNDDARVSADMACTRSCLLGLNVCALDRTARESFCAYFPPFNCILMSMTYNTLRHPTLKKKKKNNTVKSLTHISSWAQICNIWHSSCVQNERTCQDLRLDLLDRAAL